MDIGRGLIDRRTHRQKDSSVLDLQNPSIGVPRETQAPCTDNKARRRPFSFRLSTQRTQRSRGRPSLGRPSLMTDSSEWARWGVRPGKKPRRAEVASEVYASSRLADACGSSAARRSTSDNTSGPRMDLSELSERAIATAIGPLLSASGQSAPRMLRRKT